MSMDDPVFDTEDLIAWLLLNGDNLGDDGFHFNDGFQIPIKNPTEGYHEQSRVFEYPQIKVDPDSYTMTSKTRSFSSNEPNFPLPTDYSHSAFSNDEMDSDSDTELGSAKRKHLDEPGKNVGFGRKKHKTSPEELERRVKELEDENTELKAHLSNLAQRNLDKQRQRNLMENLMGQLVNSVTGGIDFDSQAKLEELLDKYTETYADYGKSRAKEIHFHLNQLEKLAVPTTTTKMVLWTLQQDKSFITSPLFDEISANLGLSPEQIERIQERRQIIKDLIKKLRESLDLIKKLRTAIANKHKILDNRLSSLKTIATSKQTVQLLFWISKNTTKLQTLVPNFTS